MADDRSSEFRSTVRKHVPSKVLDGHGAVVNNVMAGEPAHAYFFEN